MGAMGGAQELAMSTICIRVITIAAAALAAIAFPHGAMARGFGGGGGHMGGGGFGGGGGHIGGGMHSFGGGGLRSFGGGGMHSFGGGGLHSFGGVHAIGGRRSFAPAFSHRAFGVGAMRSFSRPASHTGLGHTFGLSHGLTHRGGRSIGGLHGMRHANWRGAGGMRTAGSALHAGALRSGMRAAALAGAGHALTTGTAWHGQRGFNGSFRGGFWHNHADWRLHRGFFGWAGPVFWPWFYDDLYDCIFWDYGPYSYEDPFWAYGYGDIYGALFSPYGYGELADWGSAPSVRHRVAVDAAQPESQPAPASAPQWNAMCGNDAREVVNLPIDRISAAVSPDAQQRAALDALANASAQAAQLIKAACPADVAHTPTGRLDAMERRVEAMVQAVALIRPPLDSFYGLLSDEQKARFNAIGQDNRATHGTDVSAQPCGPTTLIPEWPQAQIEKRLQPSEGQRALLDKLRDATLTAAEALEAACPAEPPATPPARLAALADRLDTLLQGVRLVRAALNDFYGSLTDEQKAQFNGIPPVVQVRQHKG